MLLVQVLCNCLFVWQVRRAWRREDHQNWVSFYRLLGRFALTFEQEHQVPYLGGLLSRSRSFVVGSLLWQVDIEKKALQICAMPLAAD